MRMTTPSEPTRPEPPPPSGYEAQLPYRPPATSDHLAETYPAGGYRDDVPVDHPQPQQGGYGAPGYPPPGYPQQGSPPGHPQPGYGQVGPWATRLPPRDGIAVAALVTGLVSVACFFIVAGPVALGLGISGLRRTTANGTRGRGMAIAGIVLGAVATLVLVGSVVNAAMDSV
ncbi:MAG: hypothetical protein JWP95_715 [Actinotalea sp.]|nr:hypothetical protein [Actinotalea sp.]